MFRKLFLYQLFLFTLTPSIAYSSDTYIGYQYEKSKLNVSGNVGTDPANVDFKPTAISARIGHFFTKSFAIEARVGFGLQDETIQVENLPDSTIGLGRMASLSAVGQANLGPQVGLYGLLGYSYTRIEANAFDVAAGTSSESGLLAGLGVRFNVNKSVGITLEYLQYFDETLIQIDIPSDINLDYNLRSIALGIELRI